MPLLPNQVDLQFEEIEDSEDMQYLLATKVNNEFYGRRFSEQIMKWQSDPFQVERSRQNYKIYHDAEHIKLQPNLTSFRTIDWENVVLNRGSKRAFTAKDITFEQLSNLLVLTCGLKENGRWQAAELPAADGSLDRARFHGMRRALPSGGAMYPLELYVLVRHVQGLEPGLYHMNVLFQRLSRIKAMPDPFDISQIMSQHALFDQPSALIYITAISERSRIKYGPRGLRFILLEAGGMATQMNLVANAMGLDFCLDGGGFESKIEAFLGIDGYREALVSQMHLGYSAG